MNPATKPTEFNQPTPHLRLVSDRTGGAASGITLSGVSKTYRSRDGDVERVVGGHGDSLGSACWASWFETRGVAALLTMRR